MKFIHLVRCNISYVASNQMWRIMKLIIIIMTAFLVQVSASTHAQQLTIKDDHIRLKEVFQQIRKQTDYTVLGKSELINKTKPLSLDLYKVPLEDALKQILAGQDLNYTIKDKAIFISKKEEPSFLDRIFDRFNRLDINGRIISSDGSPISGATVTVKGTKQSAVTDRNGLFSFDAVDEDALLIITYVGYKTKEIAAKANLNGVILELSDNPLDEVQVIAYGTTSRRLSTGNVGGIKASDIEKQPVSNPLLALQGRVSGITITQNSGLPGGGIGVNIQGLNSITKGNDPFYVIDGVPFISQLLPNYGDILGSSRSQGSTFSTQNGNPFNLINPADIESIDVLKDADATAIYGSRAANGAIIITTKKGKSGKMTVDVNMQQGFGTASRFLDVMNTAQYLSMRKEAFRNDGLALPDRSIPLSQKSNVNYDLTLWDTTRNTNWQKELIGRTASYSDMQLALSGGNSQTSFRINGGYNRQTTIFPGDFSDIKGSFSANINHTSIDKRFSISLSSKFLADNNQLPKGDLTATALALAPLSPALYNADGTLNWERIEINADTKDSVSTWLNPLAAITSTYQNKSYNLNTNLLIGYRISDGLQFRTSMGYNLQNQRDFSLNPLSVYAPELRANNTRSSNFSQGSVNSWIVEPQLTYNKQLGGGDKIELLVGTTFQQNNSQNTQLAASGFNSDQLLSDIKSAPTVTVQTSLDAKYKYSALFGRLNYNYRDKYIINLTGRRDGSSRFGSGNQLHNFGAIGAAWIFNREKFFKEVFPAVSFGKLRASYGITGNDQIGDYEFMSLYSTVTANLPYQLKTGLLPSRHENPNLQWEITKKLQAGLDLGFFRDRVLFNINYYNNRSSNQLINYPLPISTGFNFVTSNFAAKVENSGWEVGLNTGNIEGAKFRWSSSFNFTLPKNKLLAFPDLANSSYKYQLTVGDPIGINKMYVFAGVNQQTGVYQFLAANGSSIINSPSSDDATYNYSALPKYYGGFQNTFSYKDFSVDFLFQFVKQLGTDLHIGNQAGFFASSNPAGNQPLTVRERWQSKNSINSAIQKYSSTGLVLSHFYAKSSNLSVVDASFIRLKNVSFSWVLPAKWIKPAALQSARVFAQGQNLLTFTGYEGIDPETGNSAPILRMITFGIQVSL